ncbi:hypothetical protein EIKCOROL_01894 [Eikenella corrodens ATCC 23834]|uniref:Uncharacterized protein n=1 Tax=Eikenella corrodens ATCC 23834 TaxID=546274 RepID=C0DWZ1_EIKCO|nr:hypothetical protein EIKCOROL_01894 [Eikenella corrodens ATCC 23834]
MYCLRLAALPILILIRYSQSIFHSAKRANTICSALLQPSRRLNFA